MTRWPIRCAAIVACLLAVCVAEAQSTERKSAAEALFDQGVALLEAKDFVRACPLLERSEALDPAVGTLLYLADCYESCGKTASAWATFREAASLSKAQGQTQRKSIAEERARRLEPMLSKLKLGVAAGSEVKGFELTRDGRPVPKEAWGVLLPLDPGPHRFEASAPGRKTWRRTVELASKQELEVLVPELLPEEKPSSAPRADRTRKERTGSSAQSGIGLALASGGLVALGVGTYFGLRADSLDEEADEHCRKEAPTRCTQAGVDLADRARTAADVSTVAFVGGGVLFVGGALLFLTSPRPNEQTGLRVRAAPIVGIQNSGIVFDGAW